MHEKEVPVTFQPQGRTVHVLTGTLLIEAAAGAGIAVDVPCGGEGTCGKCRLAIRSGASAPTPTERNVLSAQDLESGVRLGCQSPVAGPMTVEVPQTRRRNVHQILAQTGDTPSVDCDPVVRKLFAELPAPRRDDDAPDLTRLLRSLGRFELDLDLLRELPDLLRRHHFRGTAVMAEGRLIDFEPGDTSGEMFGVAIDVGTTTLVAVLLDLATGQPLGVASRLNPQTRFGDDVLTRILAAQKPDGLRQLQQVIAESINEMIDELLAQVGVERKRVYDVTLAGNTTMQQLFCRIDPAPLGEMPFVPAFGGLLSLSAEEVDLHIHPRGRVTVLPVIGGFVGGDTVAGILATGLADLPGPALLVDIGTNGEIVLKADGKLLAASTAAGPAFEGARILHGMRGSTGAIEKVLYDGRFRTHVIGGGRPVGLCGSALIDVAAELLRHGLITPEGRMLPVEQLPANVPGELSQRAVQYEQRSAFVLASCEESGTGQAIVLTQRDVRELQLATGAIRAGIEILLAKAKLKPQDLECVLVAGGFGNFIRRNNAQRIGLLPHGVPHQRIRYQGNTSLAGAQMVALSRQARQMAEEIAATTEHVDLGYDPGFQAAFAEAMLFPECEGG